MKSKDNAGHKPVDAAASPDDDVQLLARVARRDRDAVSALYDRFGRLVYSVALHMLEKPDAAEEVVQDVFVNIWLRASSFDASRGSPTSWLLSITHNRCIDELRRRRRRARISTVDIEDAADAVATHHDDVPDAAIARMNGQAIVSALRQLPPAQRDVIVMAYFQGLTQSEISVAMGAPLGTVKTRMRLGLEKLREILA